MFFLLLLFSNPRIRSLADIPQYALAFVVALLLFKPTNHQTKPLLTSRSVSAVEACAGGGERGGRGCRGGAAGIEAKA